MSMTDRRIHMMGAPLDLLDMAETVAQAEAAMAEGRRLQQVVINVAKLVNIRSDPELRRDVLESDIINIGGYKVDPDGVESHLNQCPGITESMCVGVPDPDGITGEAVLAYIFSEKEISSKMIINSLRGKLEEYKIPKSFQSIDKIPKSSSGKIKRQVLSGGTKI